MINNNKKEKRKENNPTKGFSLDETIAQIRADETYNISILNNTITPENEIIPYIHDINNKYVNSLKENKELKETISQNNLVLKTLRHDLRIPVGNLTSIADLCLEKYAQIEREQPHTIKEIENFGLLDLLNLMKETANAGYETFSDYELWSQNNMNKPNLDLQEYNINDLIDKSDSDVMIRANNKKIRLICKPYINADAQVKTDKNYVTIILNNLISNSIKFTPEGKNIYVSAEPFDEKYLKITVQDEGTGISNDIKDKLFSLEGITTEGTKGEKGTGKGLIICSELVEKQGGKIWIDNEKDYVGTKISFTVPKYAL